MKQTARSGIELLLWFLLLTSLAMAGTLVYAVLTSIIF